MTVSTCRPASSSLSSSVCPYYYHADDETPPASAQVGPPKQLHSPQQHLKKTIANYPCPTGGYLPLLSIPPKRFLLPYPPSSASTAVAAATAERSSNSPPATPTHCSRMVLAPAPLDLPAHMPTASISVLSVRLSPSQAPSRRSCLLSAAPRRQQQDNNDSSCSSSSNSSGSSSRAYLLLNQLTKAKDRVRLWLALVLREEEGGDGSEEVVYAPASLENVVIKESDTRFIRQYGRLWGEDPVAEVAALIRVQEHQQQPGHPNIVAMQAAFEGEGVSQGLLFMVLPYLSGSELFYQVTEAKGQQGLGEEATRPILRQVLAGLLHLKQAHGIRHGDVSPENVMVAPDGNVTLIDLGMAECLPSPPSSHPSSSSSSSSPSSVLLEARPRRGKKQYMAPEIYEEREYDPFAADVWALGALLYVCWTGCTIFKSASDPHFRSLKEGGKEGGLRRLLAERERQGSTRVLSTEAKELLGGMMAWDREKRMTLEEVATHPWLAEEKVVVQREEKEETGECPGKKETQHLTSDWSLASILPAFERQELNTEVRESSQEEGREREDRREDRLHASLWASTFASFNEDDVTDAVENEKEEKEEKINYPCAPSATCDSTTPSKQRSNNCDPGDPDNSLASLRSLHHLESFQNNYSSSSSSSSNNDNNIIEINNNDYDDDFDSINNDEDQGCRLPSSRAMSSSSLCNHSMPSCRFVANEDEREGEEKKGKELFEQEEEEDKLTVSVSFSSSITSFCSVAPQLFEEAQKMLQTGL